jgi:hypothetical protein
VLLQHVVVVEQPLTRGPDVFGPAPIRGGEPVVGILEDLAGAVETGEKWCLPPRPSSGRQPLTGGELPGPLGQALGAEQLAADGPGKPILAGIGPQPGREEGEGLAGAQGDGRDLKGGVFAGEQGSIMGGLGGYGLWGYGS